MPHAHSGDDKASCEVENPGCYASPMVYAARPLDHSSPKYHPFRFALGGAMLARERSRGERRPKRSEDWRRVHEALMELAVRRAALDAEEVPWLVEGLRSRVFVQLGHATYADYLESTLGYTPRMARERVRVAEALSELPRLSANLASGRLKWTAVRELTRVATAHTEEAWLQAAHGRTLREIEQMVVGRERGSLPTDPVPREALRRRLSFDLSADAYALFQEALAHHRRSAGHPISDEEALLLMARRSLGGAEPDPGEPAHQVHLEVCPECGHGTQRAGADDVVVDPAVVEQAMCDARLVEAGQRSTTTIPPAVRREVMARDGGRCQVPGCRHHTFVDVHHIVPRAQGGTHAPSNLVVLCSAHHRAVHHGFLWLEGAGGPSLRFRHVDGTDFRRAPPDTAAVQASSDAVAALIRLGFPKPDSVAAIQAAVTHVGHSSNAESLVMEGLRILRQGARAP